VTGTPFLEIIRGVLPNGRDLVIKCPESPDWLDRFLAGDDMHLLRKCPRPVWLVKPEISAPYQSIPAAVDVDDSYPPEELKTRQALNGTVMKLPVLWLCRNLPSYTSHMLGMLSLRALCATVHS
jgi:hypothetical protein